jgi:hypothetical protein
MRVGDLDKQEQTIILDGITFYVLAMNQRIALFANDQAVLHHYKRKRDAAQELHRKLKQAGMPF